MADLSQLIQQNPNILDLLKLDQDGSLVGQSKMSLSPDQAAQQFLAAPNVDLKQEQAKNDQAATQEEQARQAKIQQSRAMAEKKAYDALLKQKQDEQEKQALDLDPKQQELRKAEDDYMEQDKKDKALEDQYAQESEQADREVAQEQSQINQQPLSLMDKYKALQQQQLDAAKNAQLAKAGNLIMQGMLTKADPKAFEAQRKLIDESQQIPKLELDQVQQQIAFQSKDPQSEVSKYLRSFIKQKFGQDIPETLSAYDLEQTSLKPMVQMQMKDIANQMTMLKFQNTKEHQQRQFEEAQKRHQDTVEHRKKMEDIASGKLKTSQSSLDLRNQMSDDKLAQQFKKDLTADLTGRGNIGQIGQSLSLVGRAEALIKKGDLNKLSPIQVRELSTAVARVIQGQGATAVSQIEHLTPQSVGSNSAKIAEWLTNAPKGAQQKAFVKMFQDMLSREKEELNKQRQNFMDRVIPVHETLKKRNPELYDKVLGEHQLNDKLDTSSHPQDNEAISWAQEKLSSGTPEEKEKALQILRTNNVLGQ